MKIGLYFGSFNPVHVGHLIIANHILNTTNTDKLWFIVSPQNPLKQTNTLLNEYHRLHLINLAIGDDSRLKASDIEFKLPKPSYTIDTLTYLSEKYPQHEFSIIMGSDSFQNITKWKNHKLLLAKYEILIYNRPGFEIFTSSHKHILLAETPVLEISATHIRNLIKEKKSFRFLVPDLVREEIELNGYYLKDGSQKQAK